ncbi:hypothetical protein PR048_007683 [Dryococelus australis]|uniref:YqaJ viral recombinase domain-containing protein n=1 Tax=Dryococelus australis TaxID=614101 RepID=A0ABQ9HUY0_9NEOP|nr:hypothetical protein PR048_007683 [Dryococelus australis]
MEQDVIVEGMLQSIGMQGLVYRLLIADGDSSVHRKLTGAMPYGTTRQVEKVECRNHTCRNYVSKVLGLCNNTKLGSYELRSALKDRIMRLRTAAMSTMKYRKKQSEDKYYLSIEELILKSPFHVLGGHSKCSESVMDSQNPEKVANNASSLILDVDNNMAENYNSVVAKFVGGKRINFSPIRGICQRKRVEHRDKKNLDSDYGPNASLSTPDASQSTYENAKEQSLDEITYQVFKGNSSTNWGIEKDSVAIAQFERENPGIEVKGSDLIMDEEYTFLGASPDGFIGDDQIIEVKCPSSAISMPPLDALAKGKIKYLAMKDGKPHAHPRLRTFFPLPPPRGHSQENAPFRLRPPDPSASYTAERCPGKFYKEVPLKLMVFEGISIYAVHGKLSTSESPASDLLVWNRVLKHSIAEGHECLSDSKAVIRSKATTCVELFSAFEAQKQGNNKNGTGGRISM